MSDPLLTCPLCGHSAHNHGDHWSCSNDPICPLGCAVYTKEDWAEQHTRFTRLIAGRTESIELESLRSQIGPLDAEACRWHIIADERAAEIVRLNGLLIEHGRTFYRMRDKLTALGHWPLEEQIPPPE